MCFRKHNINKVYGNISSGLVLFGAMSKCPVCMFYSNLLFTFLKNFLSKILTVELFG